MPSDICYLFATTCRADWTGKPHRDAYLSYRAFDEDRFVRRRDVAIGKRGRTSPTEQRIQTTDAPTACEHLGFGHPMQTPGLRWVRLILGLATLSRASHAQS